MHAHLSSDSLPTIDTRGEGQKDCPARIEAFWPAESPGAVHSPALVAAVLFHWRGRISTWTDAAAPQHEVEWSAGALMRKHLSRGTCANTGHICACLKQYPRPWLRDSVEQRMHLLDSTFRHSCPPPPISLMYQGWSIVELPTDSAQLHD